MHGGEVIRSEGHMLGSATPFWVLEKVPGHRVRLEWNERNSLCPTLQPRIESRDIVLELGAHFERLRRDVDDGS